MVLVILAFISERITAVKGCHMSGSYPILRNVIKKKFSIFRTKAATLCIVWQCLDSL